MTNQQNNSWIITPKPVHNAKVKLICLPFAGGSSANFRDWPSLLPASVELSAIEIPGRGGRLSEPLMKRIAPLAGAIASAMHPFLDRPFALFGHSMGALTGYELSHLLRSRYQLNPVHLFLSGRGAPQLPPKEKPIHGLSKEEFVQEIKRYNGTPREVLEHEELMDIMIPILRADFEVCETYNYRAKPQLDCPISVYSGLQDPGTNRKNLNSWQEHTRGPFNVRMFPGDHFYLLNAQTDLIHALARDLNNHFSIV